MLSPLEKLLMSSTDFIFNNLPVSQPKSEMLKKCKLVGHRGTREFLNIKENTLEAFSICAENNIWGIEFDIRWTKDNIPVIHHDENTIRVLQRDLWISKLDFANLRKHLPAIPTLEEIVKNFAKKLHFMIELKDSLTDEQNKILQKILSPLSPIQDYHIMSLDIPRLSTINFVDSTCFLTISKLNAFAFSNATLKQNYAGITGHYLLMNNNLINHHHKIKQKVGVGFPESKNCLFRQINKDVDWIFTNQPITQQKLINSIA